jgi:hypothetical protein
MILAPQSDEVRLINPKQVYYYLSQNVFPLRLECGYDEKIVFVFEKEATLRLFSKWRERDTDWRNNK